MTCQIAPRGWYCTRDEGHDGPCAAWPTPYRKGDKVWVVFRVANWCCTEFIYKWRRGRVVAHYVDATLVKVRGHGVREFSPDEVVPR